MDIFQSGQEFARSIVDRVAGSAGAQLLFGEAQRVGDRTVIPVGQARYGFGLGFGAGSGTPPEDQGGGSGSGGGGGGGGGVMARPIGFIEVTGDEARFVPIIDYTRVILTALICIAVVMLAALGASRADGMLGHGLRWLRSE